MSLVKILRDDVFTDSVVIADGTGNEHESIRVLIRKYEKEFSELGKVAISNRTLETRGGEQRIVFYNLNEPQASFLMTLLRNNDTTVAFKLRLVKAFYQMRMVLFQKQTSEWQITREQGKLIRRSETDAIAELIAYAEEQGSTSMRKQAYTIYSRLVNSLVGIDSGQRGIAPFKTISTIAFLEDMVSNTIWEEMANGTYYKEIYKKCKANGEQIMQFAYLPKLTA